MKSWRENRIGGVGAVALVLLAACSGGIPTTGSGTEGVTISPVVSNLSASDVIVSGTGADLGGFFNAIAAANTGRATGGAFWDNNSADNQPATNHCNVGFYATGGMPAGCDNTATGSLANEPAPGSYNKYWGDNGPAATSAGRDASSFMFKGANSYDVKLLGTFAGSGSEVGWFTKSGGVYTFHAVPGWGARDVSTAVVTIATGGADWGFYIRNTFNPQTGGCDSPDGDCSDATGGFSGMPFQQFALFGNSADPTKYLVGAEDNKLEVLPNGNFQDSDYNDYIWSIVATPPAPPTETGGGQGCTLGYWKNHTGAGKWPSPYTPSTQFSAVFENAFPGKTLLQVLGQGGGGLTALGRQTVAALLNAQKLGVTKFGMTTPQVISAFNAVFPGGDYETQKDKFEHLTDAFAPNICPLN